MLTILVVEDEFAILEVLTVALEGEGYRVLRAGHGADALRVLAHHACDLIVCDEVMPVMDGRQLIDAVRVDPRLAHMPFIMIVDTWGRPLPEIEGATVVGKPILLAQLLAAIERLAASRRDA